MTKAPTDIAASVRARLLRLARARNEDFQLVLTRYANERLLYRLTKSSHADRFVLKGAALFTLWTGEPHRATRDIDLLGFGNGSMDHIRTVLADVITIDVEQDGVVFDLDSLAVRLIREEQDYGGVRAVLEAHIKDAKVRLQVDVGFGDTIIPPATMVDYPVLLAFPAPKLRAYPRETVVAEKVEAMVKLGQANSRMKDFYDLLILSRTFPFAGDVLLRAIRATFARRGTPLPLGLPVALTTEFTEDRTKKTQWVAFLRKSVGASIGDLAAAAAAVTLFVEEPLCAAAASKQFEKQWSPGGPWAPPATQPKTGHRTA